MSVYKEAWMIINDIQSRSRYIFQDAADYGVPVVQGDRIWNAAKQLAEFYGDKDGRKVHRYSTGVTSTQLLEIADEGSKTWRTFSLEYVSLSEKNQMASGYISVSEVLEEHLCRR